MELHGFRRWSRQKNYLRSKEAPPFWGRTEEKARVRNNVVQFRVISDIHAVHSRTMVVMSKHQFYYGGFAEYIRSEWGDQIRPGCERVTGLLWDK